MIRDAEGLRHALRSVPVFRGLSQTALQTMAGIAEGRTYQRGQLVFRQGDPSDELLVVVTGRIAVSLISPAGNELMVNLIDPVQVVGEIGFIDGGPRTANGYCVFETRALLLPGRVPILVETSSDVSSGGLSFV